MATTLSYNEEEVQKEYELCPKAPTIKPLKSCGENFEDDDFNFEISVSDSLCSCRISEATCQSCCPERTKMSILDFLG